MAFEIPKTAYSGKIKEMKLGKGDKAVTVGGESCYPFYIFEGEMPRRALALILEWAQEHRAEPMEDWELCTRNQPPKKIQPLT